MNGYIRARALLPLNGWVERVSNRALAVIVLVIAAALSQPALAQPNTPGDIAAILARKELRVALPAFNSPPFFYEDRENTLQGFDIDLAHAIGRELGVPVRFERSANSFDEVIAIVAQGKADVAICKLSRTLKRAREVRFTEPYASFNHALVVNRVQFAQTADGRDPPEVIHDYRGTLGVIARSSFADYARVNFPNASIRQYPSWPDLVAAVQSGEVVTAYRDEFEIKKIIVENPGLSLTLRTITLTDQTDTLGIATAPGNEQLLAFLNMFLAQRVGLKSADDLLKLVPAARTIPENAR